MSKGITQPRPIELQLFNQEIDSTPINELVLIVDHPSFPEPMKLLYPFESANNDTLLGDNLISTSGWTATGWTGNESIGFTHTVGNTNVLSNVLAGIINTNYNIGLTVSGRTAGTFTVAFGGDTSIALNSSANYTILSTTNDNLEITPSSDFDGTITIAIKEVVYQLTEQQILDILNVTSVASEEFVTNGFVGKETGKSLVLDTDIAKIANIKTNPYEINLPSGNLTTKISGATFSPAGWGTIALSGDSNALITHTLTGRKVCFVNVFEIDGSAERLLSFDKGTAYTGVVGGATTVLVEGIAPTLLAARVEFIFN